MSNLNLTSQKIRNVEISSQQSNPNLFAIHSPKNFLKNYDFIADSLRYFQNRKECEQIGSKESNDIEEDRKKFEINSETNRSSPMKTNPYQTNDAHYITLAAEEQNSSSSSSSGIEDDDDDDDENNDNDDEDDDCEKLYHKNRTNRIDENGTINCCKIDIVKTRTPTKKSPFVPFRISLMTLFKSCFGRGPMFMRIFSALFFAIASFLLVVINKIILTTYRFPSVMILALGQVTATIIILNISRRLGVVKFPNYSREVNFKIFPLPLFFLGNLVSGLSSTQRLNLPMLTVLRRFTILMTMIGEYYLLGVKQSNTIKMTVFMMIGGAMIAASNDLAFDAAGYLYVLLNDFFSTLNGIYMKKKLDSRDLGKYGILYYNALFIFVPLFLISISVDDWSKCFFHFEHWYSPVFVFSFLMSCVMGFILMYSTALCTQYNSALTTTIVGCLKNILVTFIGMYIGGDYIFSAVNFIGLNISMIGSLIYSYVIFVHKSSSTSTSSSQSQATPSQSSSALCSSSSSSSSSQSSKSSLSVVKK
ncbi:OPI10 protein [Sarcoptes scabiei]|nr:OPI10 protein [Sarcoptes scabiei]